MNDIINGDCVTQIKLCTLDKLSSPILRDSDDCLIRYYNHPDDLVGVYSLFLSLALES